MKTKEKFEHLAHQKGERIVPKSVTAKNPQREAHQSAIGWDITQCQNEHPHMARCTPLIFHHGTKRVLFHIFDNHDNIDMNAMAGITNKASLTIHPKDNAATSMDIATNPAPM